MTYSCFSLELLNDVVLYYGTVYVWLCFDELDDMAWTRMFLLKDKLSEVQVIHWEFIWILIVAADLSLIQTSITIRFHSSNQQWHKI